MEGRDSLGSVLSATAVCFWHADGVHGGLVLCLLHYEMPCFAQPGTFYGYIVL